MKYRTLSITDDIYKLFSKRPNGIEVDTNLIKSLLLSDKPCMISRFGSSELQTLWYSKFRPFSFLLKKRILHNIQYASGFFPITKKNIKKFYSLYREDTKELDVLVSWRIEEIFFKNWFNSKLEVKKTTLDSFYSHEHPWTYALKGKRILVIHPFAETIECQYRYNRKNLFKNQEVLPEFSSLETIKAVQSIAGNPVGFESWFDALEWMKQEIDKKDFDIALIGCGAYSLPLAAYVKRIGRKSIHMGGVLQFLFGITSKRYNETERYKPYINEYFVLPDSKDRPQNASMVEGGCYW